MNSGPATGVQAGMVKAFETRAAPMDAPWSSGYAAGQGANPSRWADEMFGASIPGPWLLAYMIRRFGWPNAGSDDYKDLCSWMLTTPIEGLYLVVTPYLGNTGGKLQPPFCGNLHFAVRFTKQIGEQLDRDPGREAFQRRRARAMRAWWNKHGCKMYVFGWGTKDGDADVLVHEYGQKDGKVWGLWKRPPRIKRPQSFPKEPDGMLLWWLGEFLTKNHPEAKLPAKLTERERVHRETSFHKRARKAIEATLADLLRPVRVRDISFNPLGHTDGASKPEAERFEGAGYAAEYWFTKALKKRAKVAA